MKKLLFIVALFCSLGINAQVIKNNIEYRAITMFSGKPIVQDTSLIIKSGNDTIRITSYGDASRLSTTAGGGWVFSPALPGGVNQKFAPTRVPFAAPDSTLTTDSNFYYSSNGFLIGIVDSNAAQNGLFSGYIPIGPFTIPLTSISRSLPSGAAGGLYLFDGAPFGQDSASVLLSAAKNGIGTDGASVSLDTRGLGISYASNDTSAIINMNDNGMQLSYGVDTVFGGQININNSGNINLSCSGIATYNGVEIATVGGAAGVPISPAFGGDTLFAYTQNYFDGQIGLTMLGYIPKQIAAPASIAGNVLIGAFAGNELQQPEYIYDNCVGNTIIGDNGAATSDSLSRATIVGWQSQYYNSNFYRGITTLGATTQVNGDYGVAVGIASTAYESGVAIGLQAQAATNGISLGKYSLQADSNTFSISDYIKKLDFQLNPVDSLGFQCQGCILTNIDGQGLGQWTWSSQSTRDSVNIYSLTSMPAGTQVYCSDCTGNGITGRILAFIGGAWRRLLFD